MTLCLVITKGFGWGPFASGSPWKGRIKPSPAWLKPSSLAAEDWIQQLELSWNEVEQSSSYHELVHSVQNLEPDSQTIIQKEWDQYMDCLQFCYQHSLETLSSEGQTKVIQAESARLLKQNGKSAKGAVAKHQWVRDSTLVKGNPNPGEGLRGLRRKLARAFEIRRCCKRHFPPPQELLAKVCPHMRQASLAVILAHVETVIEDIHSQQNALEESNRHHRLNDWKSRMNAGTFKQLGRWIRRKECNFTAFQLYDQAEPSRSREEATKKIFEHQVRLQESQQVDLEQASQFLSTWFGQSTNFPVQGVSFSNLWKIIRNGDGAAGPDGWSANELRYLPLPAIRLWEHLGSRWIQAGTVPQQLTEVRQVNLPKVHKIDQDGRLSVQGLRPISILSAFWRLWASAFIKDEEVSQWISQNKHPDIIHGRNSLGCETAAQLLQSSYVNDQFICSLDYQEAYDRMHPAITFRFLQTLGWPLGFCQVVAGTGADSPFTAAQVFAKLGHQRYAGSMDFTKCYDLMIPCGTAALLEAGGWPRGLVQVIAYMWQHQQRWVSWDRHTHGAPLAAGTCVPQGCSFGPLALAAWMAAGVRATEHHRETVFTRVFMNDRTIVSSDPQFLVNQIQRWETWSESVGLLESKTKTQLTGATQLCRTRLASVATEPAKVQSSFEILGCCAQVSRRTESTKEKKRLAAGHRTLQLIGNLGWPFERVFACGTISCFI